MGDAHRTVGGVHALAAGTTGSEDVDAEIVGVDLDIDLLRFRQHRYRRGGRMNAALGFRGGNALDAMHTGLAAKESVRIGTPDREDGFLYPAERALGDRKRFHLQPVSLR